jgi:uncharacterized protein
MLMATVDTVASHYASETMTERITSTQSPTIEIRTFKKLDISGGVLIEGFPSVGLASAIAGTYIVRSLKLNQIAAIDSTRFPSVSIISAEKLEFPARIYASADHKIAVCLSEFTIPADLEIYVAKSILSWSHDEKCSLVISSCGMPTEHDNQNHKNPIVLGVGSNERTRLGLKSVGISLLESGVVPGITGALLNEGKLSNADVAGLLYEVYSEMPDTRVVAGIVEAIAKLLPQLHLDVTSLYQDAEKIENILKTTKQQTSELNPSVSPSPYT